MYLEVAVNSYVAGIALEKSFFAENLSNCERRSDETVTEVGNSFCHQVLICWKNPEGVSLRKRERTDTII